MLSLPGCSPDVGLIIGESVGDVSGLCSKWDVGWYEVESESGDTAEFCCSVWSCRRVRGQ